MPGSISLSLSITANRNRGWTPAALFRPAGRDGLWLEPRDQFTFAGDDVPALVDKQGGPNWTTTGSYIYRRDGALKLSWEYVSGNRFGATVADFGTDCTIAYVDYTTGVVITTGQTVNGAITLPAVSRLGPYLIVNDALSVGETTQLTTYLTLRRPGNWILGNGSWDDNGVWDDAAYWEDAA
jgi:hypothetical protein